MNEILVVAIVGGVIGITLYVLYKLLVRYLNKAFENLIDLNDKDVFLYK